MSEFALPDVGEGLTEADVVQWRVEVGDTVAINDIVCEIETAKSVVELPTPYAGEVTALLVPLGTTVPVGTPLIRIGADAVDAVSAPGAAPDATPAAAPNSSPDEAVPETLVGSGPKTVQSARHVLGAPGAGAVLAKPAARLAAREAGVDLSTITPARADGVIVASDVAYPSVTQGSRPTTQLQRAMAEAMTASAAIPQVTIWTTVDATRTVELAERLGVRLMTLIARITTLALSSHPLLNSTFTDDGVILHGHINLGIAAATPRGLVVPHIREADLLDLAGLQVALEDLVATARAGRTPPAAQVGGTFTITNIGPFGIEGGTPLINPGESGILCLGAVAKRPWVVADAVAVRDVVTLALTFDHRHIDGEAGSRFLKDVGGIIEEPGSALAFR